MTVLVWPNGLVPYNFDKNIIAKFREWVILAMREITYYTRCIEFVHHNREKDYLFITKGERCFSHVGRGGGRQELFLDTDQMERPVILHELCHALGLYHEHQRPMRDDFIKIHYENIKEEDRVHFIKMIPEDDIAEFEFDYYSVMLYGNKSFAKDDTVSITAIKERYLPVTEKKKCLSTDDIKKLKYLYRKSQGRDSTYERPDNQDMNAERPYLNRGQQNRESHDIRSKSGDNTRQRSMDSSAIRQRPRTPNFRDSLNEYREKAEEQQTFAHSKRSMSHDEMHRGQFGSCPNNKYPEGQKSTRSFTSDKSGELHSYSRSYDNHRQRDSRGNFQHRSVNYEPHTYSERSYNNQRQIDPRRDFHHRPMDQDYNYRRQFNSCANFKNPLEYRNCPKSRIEYNSYTNREAPRSTAYSHSYCARAENENKPKVSSSDNRVDNLQNTVGSHKSTKQISFKEKEKASFSLHKTDENNVDNHQNIGSSYNIRERASNQDKTKPKLSPTEISKENEDSLQSSVISSNNTELISDEEKPKPQPSPNNMSEERDDNPQSSVISCNNTELISDEEKLKPSPINMSEDKDDIHSNSINSNINAETITSNKDEPIPDVSNSKSTEECNDGASALPEIPTEPNVSSFEELKPNVE